MLNDRINVFNENLKGMETPYKVYSVAAVLFLSGSVIAGVAPTWPLIHQPFFVSALAVFAAGFLVWSWPLLKKAWDTLAGKITIAVLNLFALILSTMLARNLVAESLGLPPQDFDLAVHFFVLLLVVPSWTLFVSLLCGIYAVFSFIVGLVRLRGKPSWGWAKPFAHAMGAFAISWYAANTFDFFSTNTKTFHPLVKWVAYVGDFQPSLAYPGIKANERVRLHENGVISSAVIENGEVVIYVRGLR